MVIERANVSDARELLEVQKISYLSEAELYDDYTMKPLTETVEEVKMDIEKDTVFKAVEDGKLVGSVRVKVKDDGSCFIGRLFVHPAFQKKGIGKALLLNVEEVFKKAERFELFTGSKSTHNIGFYGSLGYKEFKTVKYSEKSEIVYMEKLVG